MEFIDFYKKSQFGLMTLEAFDELGVTTPYRVHALLALYGPKQLPRQTLRGIVGIENNGQFTRCVINPLMKDGYIEVLRNAEVPQKRDILITSTGEAVVEEAALNLEEKINSMII